MKIGDHDSTMISNNNDTLASELGFDGYEMIMNGE